MVGTVGEGRLHPHDREAGDRPLVEHGPEALLHRRDIFARHAATHHRILKFKRLGSVVRQRIEPADDVGKLPRTTRLLLVLVFIFRGSGRGLAVAHLRSAHLHLHLELALDPLDIDIEVKLTHAGDQRLACLLVGRHAERRIFAGEPLQSLAQLVEPVAVGGGDRHLDHRLRHKHALQRAVFGIVGVGIARGSIDAHHSHDIPSFGQINFLALVGMHPHDPAETLLLAGALIDIGFALFDLPLIDPHERELAVGIVDDLEGHRHQRLLRIGVEVELLVGLRPVLGDHLPLQRIRQVADDGIEQGLHALVLVSRATENRRDALVLHCLLHHGMDFVFGHGQLAEELFHERIGIHRQRLEHFVPGLGGRLGQACRNRLATHGLAVVAIKIERLHGNQIDHTLKLVFLADRNLHPHRIAAELFLELLDDAIVVGAGAVHLVDDRQPRHLVPLHLAIDRHRLALHATHGAEHQNRAVEHAQRAFHLNGEIDVARSIDEVDVAVVPLHAGGGAGDRDPALPLQIHVVHRGAVTAALDLLDAMDAPCVKENALRKRCFAGVDMGRNAHVAKLGEIHETGTPEGGEKRGMARKNAGVNPRSQAGNILFG